MKKKEVKLSSKKDLKKRGSKGTLSFYQRKRISKSKNKGGPKLERLRKKRTVKAKEAVKKKKSAPSKKAVQPKTKRPKLIKARKIKPKRIRIKKAEVAITSSPKLLEAYKAAIKVVGVGGAGVRIVSEISRAGSMPGVEFIAIDTDKQSFLHREGVKTIAVGQSLTRGLGAGMDVQLGREAIESDKDKVQTALAGADMVFIVSGLGGGTGSGASPVIAEIAQKTGALVVGMVTKPFDFEGPARIRIAEEALEEIESRVNTLITISNNKLWQQIERETSLKKAFGIIDKILSQGVQGIVDLIVTPGLINVDFADVRAVMEKGGHALIGISQARGEDRAEKAAQEVINSPLLDVSIEGAKGILFCIAGGEDLKMFEVNEAAKIVTENVDPEAKIIFGAVKDKNLEGKIKIILIATGLGGMRAKSLDEDFDKGISSKEGKSGEDKESSFEIPAFIRRKR